MASILAEKIPMGSVSFYYNTAFVKTNNSVTVGSIILNFGTIGSVILTPGWPVQTVNFSGSGVFWPASNWTYISGNHTPYLALRTGTMSGPVGVRVANACDPGGSPAIKYTQVNNCGWRFYVSPNPTNGNIIVFTTEDQKQPVKGINQIKIYQLRIIDQLGNVKKQYRYPSGITNVNISTSKLAAGVYVVHAYNGKSWEALKFVKN